MSAPDNVTPIGRSERLSLDELEALREEKRLAEARRSIRRLDMAALLSRPPRPVPYVIDGLVREGALTTIAGAAGSGKSWLAMAACAAVGTGAPLGGTISVQLGKAVYVDAEMGADQMVDRFRVVGFPPGRFEVLDARGLDLGQPSGIDALAEQLVELHPSLIVFDSLRRLAPGKRENDSDDMAPLVAAMANLLRDLPGGPGGILLHHSGHGDGHFARGSSAIADQSDAVFGYTVEGETRCLSCHAAKGGKFRFGREPEDRYFRHEIGTDAGVVVVTTDRAPVTTTTPTRPMREVYADRIVEILGMSNGLARNQLAVSLGVDPGNQNLRAALRDLEQEDRIEPLSTGGWWLVEGGGDSDRGEDHHHHPDSSAQDLDRSHAEDDE